MNNNLFKYNKKKIIIPFLLILLGLYIRNLYILFSGIIMFMILIFMYRKPNIHIRKYNRHIISPAYGRILHLVHNHKNIIISIYSTLLSPSVHYIPYNGILQTQQFINGTKNPASNLKKSTTNKRVISNISTKIGYITIIQYCGMLDQNIGILLHPKRRVYQGQELGTGSRLDLVIPYHPRIFPRIRVGDYVYAGSTLFSW